MIPEDHKNSVVSTGLHFMRAITEAYGADQGLRLWETIADTLDGDVKGQIFFAMITGTHNDTIVLREIATSDYIAAIKEIRNWTGLGLKDAKDTVDLVREKRTAKIKVKPTEYHRAVSGLIRVGFVV